MGRGWVEDIRRSGIDSACGFSLHCVRLYFIYHSVGMIALYFMLHGFVNE